MLTLRQKFGLLLAGLVAAVLLLQATAVWSIVILEREIAWPMRGAEASLRSISDSRRTVEKLAQALGHDTWLLSTAPTREREVDSAAVSTFAELLLQQLDQLQSPDSEIVRTGISSTRTLMRQGEAAAAAAIEAASTPDRIGVAIAELSTIHNLLGRLEQHVLNNTTLQVRHATTIRAYVLGVSAACLVALALTVLLGLLLFTRWIVQPVAMLRTATTRIAAGDYGHRVPVRAGDEIGQLSGEVNQMAQTIGTMIEERVERERLAAVGEMVRRVTHNLRNPLSGIRSLAEVTRAELPHDSDLRDVQSRIMATVDRFEIWLRDLLRTTQPLELVPVRLGVNRWINDILPTLLPLAESKSALLNIQTSPAEVFVMADPVHLEHAVIAVVTNAIDAAGTGGRTVVSVSPDGQDWVRIDVIDDGPGIPAEHRHRIFEQHFTTKPGGTGIGLAMAKYVIQQHRGTITSESAEHPLLWRQGAKIGACIRIRIPSAPEH